MGIVSDFFAAGVVVLAAVGQLDTSFGRGCLSFVGVASVEKCSHGWFLRKFQVPDPWLGVSAHLSRFLRGGCCDTTPLELGRGCRRQAVGALLRLCVKSELGAGELPRCISCSMAVQCSGAFIRRVCEGMAEGLAPFLLP